MHDSLCSQTVHCRYNKWHPLICHNIRTLLRLIELINYSYINLFVHCTAWPILSGINQFFLTICNKCVSYMIVIQGIIFSMESPKIRQFFRAIFMEMKHFSHILQNQRERSRQNLTFLFIFKVNFLYQNSAESFCICFSCLNR